MRMKPIIILAICLIIVIYVIAFLRLDLTDNAGKVAVDNHLIISKDQAISLAMDELDFQNLTVNIDQQDATLTFGVNKLDAFIPMFEWVVHIHGLTPDGFNAGGIIYIEAFTGNILFTCKCH